MKQTDTFHADVTGTDASVKKPNNWVKHLDGNPHLSSFGIQCSSGDASSRIADIVADPANPENKVLQFWIKGPVKGKARIQSNVSGRGNLKQWYSKSKIYLHPDLAGLRTHEGGIGTGTASIDGHPIWFTFAEFRNNPGWGKSITYPFRITLAIRKDAGAGENLRFGLIGEVKARSSYETVWTADSKDYTIPFGEWLVSETYFKEGGKETGRFYWSLTRTDGTKSIIFDVRDFTHHPDDPSPAGMEIFSPFKLYTSPVLIEVIRNKGGTTQIFWDDWEFWSGFAAPENPKRENSKEAFK